MEINYIIGIIPSEAMATRRTQRLPCLHVLSIFIINLPLLNNLLTRGTGNGGLVFGQLQVQQYSSLGSRQRKKSPTYHTTFDS